MSYGALHTTAAAPAPVWTAGTSANQVDDVQDAADRAPFYVVDVLRDEDPVVAAFGDTPDEALKLAAHLAALLNGEKAVLDRLRDSRNVLAAADRSKAWEEERQRCRAACETLIATLERARAP